MKSAERAQAAADSNETPDGLDFTKYILLGFGGIALFVGSFVSPTRSRSPSLSGCGSASLRTLGASRRQVLGSIVLESLVIGLVGSTIGLSLGLAIAMGLRPCSSRPASGCRAAASSSPQGIIVSIAVGTLITLLASLRPAVRATRVEPIAAVREGAVMPASRFARYAVLTSSIVGTISVALFSYGVFGGGDRAQGADPLAGQRWCCSCSSAVDDGRAAGEVLGIISSGMLARGALKLEPTAPDRASWH